jgi:hypothetical protein
MIVFCVYLVPLTPFAPYGLNCTIAMLPFAGFFMIVKFLNGEGLLYVLKI